MRTEQVLAWYAQFILVAEKAWKNCTKVLLIPARCELGENWTFILILAYILLSCLDILHQALAF